MLLALDGNSTAYRTLLDELSRLLKQYFMRRLYSGGITDAEDLVQEVLLAIHTRRITYNRDLALLPWVNGIAHHKLVDHFRRQGKNAASPIDEYFPAQDEVGATDARLDVDRMLNDLPGCTAGLIRSVKIEGRSIDDTAHLSGLSQSAVKVAIHRGLAKLAQRFGGKTND